MIELSTNQKTNKRYLRRYKITKNPGRNVGLNVIGSTDWVAHTEGSMNNKLRVATWNVAAINNNPFEYLRPLDHTKEFNK